MPPTSEQPASACPARTPLDKSTNDENVRLTIHQLFNERAVVRLRERNGGLGGSNDLGDEDFGPTVQQARDVSFSGNNGRVIYTATIGVSA